MHTKQEIELYQLIMNDDGFGVTPSIEEWKQWDWEAYCLIRDLFFDGDSALVDRFLIDIPGANLKDFYSFIDMYVRAVNYPMRPSEHRPQKHRLIEYGREHQLLVRFTPFFEYYFAEISVSSADFSEVLARYWHKAHIPL